MRRSLLLIVAGLVVGLPLAARSADVVITGGCPESGFKGSVSDGVQTGYFESCDTATLSVTKLMDENMVVLAEHRFDKTAEHGLESTFLIDGITVKGTDDPSDFTQSESERMWLVEQHPLGALFRETRAQLAAMGMQQDGWPFATFSGTLILFSTEGDGEGGGGPLDCDDSGVGCCGDKDDGCKGCCGKACEGCSGFCSEECWAHDNCERLGGPGPDVECTIKAVSGGNSWSGCAVGRHARTRCSCEAIGLADGEDC